MNDLSPTLLLSLASGALVYFVVIPITNNFVKLLVGILIGIVFYFLTAKLLRLPELKEAISIIKRK